MFSLPAEQQFLQEDRRHKYKQGPRERYCGLRTLQPFCRGIVMVVPPRNNLKTLPVHSFETMRWGTGRLFHLNMGQQFLRRRIKLRPQVDASYALKWRRLLYNVGQFVIQQIMSQVRLAAPSTRFPFIFSFMSHYHQLTVPPGGRKASFCSMKDLRWQRFASMWQGWPAKRMLSLANLNHSCSRTKSFSQRIE